MDIKADIKGPLNTRPTMQTAAPVAAAPRVAAQATVAASAMPPVSDTLGSNAVAGMGVYIDRAVSDGVPKWEVMTALRAYGLNLQDKEPAAVQEPQAKAQEPVARTADVVPLVAAKAPEKPVHVAAKAPKADVAPVKVAVDV